MKSALPNLMTTGGCQADQEANIQGGAKKPVSQHLSSEGRLSVGGWCTEKCVGGLRSGQRNERAYRWKHKRDLTGGAKMPRRGWANHKREAVMRRSCAEVGLRLIRIIF